MISEPAPLTPQRVVLVVAAAEFGTPDVPIAVTRTKEAG